MNQVYLMQMVLVLITTANFLFYKSYTRLNKSLVSLFSKNPQADTVMFSFSYVTELELKVSLSQLLKPEPLLLALTKQ